MATMSANDLISWRFHLNLTQSEASAELDVSLRTYQRWESKGAPIVVALACRALYHRLNPWPH